MRATLAPRVIAAFIAGSSLAACARFACPTPTAGRNAAGPQAASGAQVEVELAGGVRLQGELVAIEAEFLYVGGERGVLVIGLYRVRRVALAHGEADVEADGDVRIELAAWLAARSLPIVGLLPTAYILMSRREPVHAVAEGQPCFVADQADEIATLRPWARFPGGLPGDPVARRREQVRALEDAHREFQVCYQRRTEGAHRAERATAMSERVRLLQALPDCGRRPPPIPGRMVTE